VAKQVDPARGKADPTTGRADLAFDIDDDFTSGEDSATKLGLGLR
jgi:hypothetical protein